MTVKKIIEFLKDEKRTAYISMWVQFSICICFFIAMCYSGYVRQNFQDMVFNGTCTAMWCAFASINAHKYRFLKNFLNVLIDDKME